MTVIIEFILSLLASLVVGPLLALVEVLSSLLVFVVELVFLIFRFVLIAIFKGPAAAKEFYRSHHPQFKRKKWRSQSLGIENESAAAESGSEASQIANTPSRVSPVFLLITLILISRGLILINSQSTGDGKSEIPCVTFENLFARRLFHYLI